MKAAERRAGCEPKYAERLADMKLKAIDFVVDGLRNDPYEPIDVTSIEDFDDEEDRAAIENPALCFLSQALYLAMKQRPDTPGARATLKYLQ